MRALERRFIPGEDKRSSPSLNSVRAFSQQTETP
jgi:hypothetical protein